MTMTLEDSDSLALAVKALDVLTLGTQCPICLETMKTPVRIPCGHSFCKMCIEQHLIVDLNDSTGSASPGTLTVRTCPLRCQQKLTKRCIRPDKNLEIMIAHILELEKSFELDVGGLIDLSQVRNRRVDGEGLEAPRESPKPGRTLSDVPKGTRNSKSGAGLAIASTSRALSTLEDGSSKIEPPVRRNNGSSSASGDVPRTAVEANTKKTPKRKSEEKEKAKGTKTHVKVSEYIFADDDDDNDDAMSGNDFDPDILGSGPSRQASTIVTEKDVCTPKSPLANPNFSPTRSVVAKTSTPTLNRRRSSVKTKPSVAMEKRAKESIVSPSRSSEACVLKQSKKDPTPSKVPVPSPARSVQVPALNSMLSISPSTPEPSKPRFQFLWRGMKKADAVLQSETKPRKKIPFLKLGQLASVQEKMDANATPSDIEVDNSIIDSNVQECRDFDEVVADDEQEHVQPHVSPTQEASRSILTQHPVGNLDLLNLETSQSTQDSEKRHGVQAKIGSVAKMSNYGKRTRLDEEAFAEDNLIGMNVDSNDKNTTPGVKTSKRMMRDDSDDEMERPSKRRISSSDESDAEGEASMLQSTQEMEKELQRLKAQKLKETILNRSDSENIIESISDDDEDMLTNTPQTNRRSLNLSYASRKKGLVVETPVPVTSAAPLKEQNLNSSFNNSQESNWADTDEDVASYCVISTGLNKSKRESFSKFLKTFNILTSKSLNDDVTHVVIDVTDDNLAIRTLKYIQALSMGKTIASFSWVVECMEAGKILPTIRFEPKDSGGELGPQRSRIYFMNGLGQKLFQNYSFCLMGIFVNEVPRIDIENILTRLGGQVVKNVADLSANRRGGRQRFVIVENSKTPNPEVKRIFSTCRVVVLSKEWVLDSVGAFQLKNILPYVQGSIKKEDLMEAGYTV